MSHKKETPAVPAASATSPSIEFKAPFFILGCVRSGTTMLRNILRMHPNLASPEETHFFRWAEPFGTEGYLRVVSSNPVLKKHREIDGITEDEFRDMLNGSRSRADLYHKYMTLFVQRRKPAATRWFDKTPQNVYGAAMIAASMPRVRFVHIVRNPVNVAASLRIGRVMKVERVVGAANYWNESVDTVMVIKRAYPGRVHEVRYEDFVNDPLPHLQALLAFIDEPFDSKWFAAVNTREIDHTEEGVLSKDDMDRVARLCGAGRKRYGYDDAAPAAAAPAVAVPAHASQPAAGIGPAARLETAETDAPVDIDEDTEQAVAAGSDLFDDTPEEASRSTKRAPTPLRLRIPKPPAS